MPCKCLFPQSCVSPVIKSHWSSKSNFLGVLSVFVRFPQVGEFLWALELLQQCENFFDIIVLQFEGHLLGGSTAGLMANSSKRICATRHAPMSAKAPAPCPHGRPLLTCASTGTLGHSKAGLIQFFVGLVGVAFRDFNLLHRTFLKRFPLFIWLLFALFSVSNFRPDTGGWR